MAKAGYIKIRRGIQEHLELGNLSYLDFGIYCAIHLQADYEKGTWKGSAPKLLYTGPLDVSLRQIQRSLQRLENKRYIKRLRTQGKRGNYVTLIDKYEPQFGALKGKRLNANASSDYKSIKYETCTDVDTEASLRTKNRDTELTPIPEVRSTPTPPASPKSNTTPPTPPRKPRGGNEEFFIWSGEKIAVRMNGRKRLLTQEQASAMIGASAHEIVQFLRTKGFEARVVLS